MVIWIYLADPWLGLLVFRIRRRTSLCEVCGGQWSSGTGLPIAPVLIFIIIKTTRDKRTNGGSLEIFQQIVKDQERKKLPSFSGFTAFCIYLSVKLYLTLLSKCMYLLNAVIYLIIKQKFPLIPRYYFTKVHGVTSHNRFYLHRQDVENLESHEEKYRLLMWTV